MERPTWAPAVLGLVFAAAAAPVVWLQAEFDRSGVVDDPGARIAYPLAGLLLAGTYVCVLLVLLRTPLRLALRVVFEPLGRMALTNYLTATVLVLGVAAVVGHAERWSSKAVLVIAGVILTVQWVWSTLWLRRYRAGPAGVAVALGHVGPPSAAAAPLACSCCRPRGGPGVIS
jgi:uncharacterized membrane protein YeiB